MSKSIPPNSNGNLAMPEFKNAAEIMRHEIQALMPFIQDSSFQAPRVAYPESRFRAYFAPFFLGVYEVPQGENIQMLWVSEVGSLHTEVDVVDGGGNILFVVPPLMNLEGVNLKVAGSSRVRYASINQVYDENARNFPEKARVEYLKGLGQKLGTSFRGIQTDPAHVHKWLKIFQYYNVTPPSNEQYRIVANDNYKAPGAPSAGPFAAAQDWSNLGRLDFTPTFD